MTDENKNTGMIDLSSDELSQLTGKTLGPLQQKINEFNLKAAGAGWNFFKRAFATASEPFFRKEMGERYFDNTGLVGGLYLWLSGTILAYSVPQSRSIVWLFVDLKEHVHWARIFSNHYFTVAVGVAMMLLHLFWGSQSVQLMKQLRADETPYHSRSRGVPRWGEGQGVMALLMIGFLLIFNLPVAVLFIFALVINANIRAEQEAAIMSRYLDAMDRELENQYLEDAALGKCPTEKTFLNKPISDKFKPEMRSNIAASLVGKPVRIMAQTPKPKRATDQP